MFTWRFCPGCRLCPHAGRPPPGKSPRYLGLLAARMQFSPHIWIVVHLPTWTQREDKFLASEDPESRHGDAIVGSKEEDTGKGILLQLVHLWNIPAVRLQLMKVWVSSLGKPSSSKCSQKYGSTTESVSSSEYLHLDSPNTKVLLGRWAKGSLALGSAAGAHSHSSISSGAGANEVKILNHTAVTYHLSDLDSHFT